MRKIAIDALHGDEVLAKDIFNQNDNMLLPAGMKVKKEYIEHLKHLSIPYLYVKDEISVGVDDEEMTELKMQEICLAQVKETLERFSYNGRTGEDEITKVSEEIITEVLQQKDILYNISGVRNRSLKVYEHSLNVCALSVMIALKMNLPKSKVREVAIGSLLHDIGYICVNVDLSITDSSKYTLDDLKELKKHVIYGYNLVETEDWLSATSKEIILSHHEMCNASGYPFRLNKDHLKIGTKIVSVCNDFDRLIYGGMSKAMKVHDAIEYIVSQSGVKFEHEVVRVFNESIAAFPNGTLVLTNENEIGIVLRQNNKCPTRPVIRIIRDSQGNRCSDWIEKDFTKYLTLFVTDTVEKL